VHSDPIISSRCRFPVALPIAFRSGRRPMEGNATQMHRVRKLRIRFDDCVRCAASTRIPTSYLLPFFQPLHGSSPLRLLPLPHETAFYLQPSLPQSFYITTTFASARYIHPPLPSFQAYAIQSCSRTEHRLLHSYSNSSAPTRTWTHPSNIFCYGIILPQSFPIRLKIGRAMPFVCNAWSPN
jgi:hypothetical protein